MIKNIVIGIVLIIFFFLVIITTFHHIMLSIENKKIEVVGTSVEIDGYNMNVYIKGTADKKENKPTIVLLSGSGVTAPVYEYKELYSKLTDEYRVAVVEKFGYGYSDVSGIKRDLETMVEENREALRKVGILGPYILMPHSMSALESIYWANTYPDEVKSIIRLDMAVPNSYDEDKNNISKIKFLKAMIFVGIHRISFFCYINKDGLSDKEIEQYKYLIYRNSLNKDVYNECKMVYNNAKVVNEIGTPDIQILMFTSDLGGSDGWAKWVEAQDDFASKSNKCIQIKLHCGHNIHYFESEYIAEQIKIFLACLN